MRYNALPSQSGLSLIATVLTLLLFSLFIAVAVSLVTTGANIGVQEEQGVAAFYIAEGGGEYGKRFLRPYSSWYAFSTDPVNVATNQALGKGSFTTDIYFPATSLRANLGGGVGNTNIRVRTTARFPTTFPFYIRIDNEFLQCTGPGANPPAFSCTRGQLGSAIAPHAAGTSVYPVLILSANISAGDTTIPFTGNPSKFLTRGTIFIDDPVNGNEEIRYSGIQTSPTQAFTGCVRGVNETTAVLHNAGVTIIPIQSTQEAFISSRGSITGTLFGDIRREISDVANQ